MCGPTTIPLLIYIDASFENQQLRLGWVIFDSRSSDPPTGGSCCVPPQVIQSWKPRNQQIFPGETLCGLLLPYIQPDLLEGRDLLWFVDNEAAVSALVRAASSEEDVHELAQLSRILLFRLRSRPWYEWVDSESNPSDGLSRLGLADPWSKAQGWSLQEHQFPLELCRGVLLETLLRDHDI